MKLLTVDTAAGGTAGALIGSGEVVIFAKAALSGTVEAWLPHRLADIFKAGPEGLAVVRRIVERVAHAQGKDRDRLTASGSLMPLSQTRLLTPIPEPSLIVAAGLAYASHLKEMSNTPAPPHPTAFLKIPASINGPEGSIAVPPQAADHIDFEGELALVIGRACHNVSPETALDYVVGYTICNDISARDWVRQVMSASEAWEARWSWEVNIMGKSLPGFTPIGPVITTADEIGDPHALQLTTRLNGQDMQSGETSDLIYSLAETLSYFSRWYTFQPGDILATGTPSGVGAGRKPPVFMKAGDIIEVEISKIGVLRNYVVSS